MHLIELIFEYRVRAIAVLYGEPPVSIVDQCLANCAKLILVNRNANRADLDVILSDGIIGSCLAAKRPIFARC